MPAPTEHTGCAGPTALGPKLTVSRELAAGFHHRPSSELTVIAAKHMTEMAVGDREAVGLVWNITKSCLRLRDGGCPASPHLAGVPHLSPTPTSAPPSLSCPLGPGVPPRSQPFATCGTCWPETSGQHVSRCLCACECRAPGCTRFPSALPPGLHGPRCSSTWHPSAPTEGSQVIPLPGPHRAAWPPVWDIPRRKQRPPLACSTQVERSPTAVEVKSACAIEVIAASPLTGKITNH